MLSGTHEHSIETIDQIIEIVTEGTVGGRGTGREIERQNVQFVSRQGLDCE
jgi:hypothetical protein